MKQGRDDLKQAALRACFHAAVILTGIQAGAVAAHDAAEHAKAAAAPEAVRIREDAASAATSGRTAQVVLDAEALRFAARFGHAVVGLNGSRISTSSTGTATVAEQTCTTARAARVYALVDPMLVPEARIEVSMLAQTEKLTGGPTALDLKEIDVDQQGASDLDRANQLLPWLIELPQEEGREALAQLTMGWARERNGAVWVVSGCPVEVLASLLARAMQARLVDGRPVLLRLADARVIDALKDALDADQQQALWSHAAQWRYLDRRGRLQNTEAPTSPVREQTRRPLVLSEAQIGQLLGAAEPDEVLSYVQRLAGDRLSALTAAERHAFAMRQIVEAKSLGMDSSQEIGLYAAMTLKTGEEFLSRASWQPVLRQVHQGELSWIQLLTGDGPQH